MILLTIRTDTPTAEIGLFDDNRQLAHDTWHAHHELAATIQLRIADMLWLQQKTLQDIEGIICFAGPGSFTGLRIGLTVGNTMAYALRVPIVAMMENDWIEQGVAKLRQGRTDALALPHYGAPVHITTPKR
jgi:tRNA threonylcarbamoyladenosine biosynthesis protein TsaB